MVDIQLEFANPRQNGVTVFGSFLDDLLYVFPVHLVGDGGAQNVQGLFHALTAFRLGLEFWVKKRSVSFEMSFWCLHFIPKNERKQVDIIVKGNYFVRFLGESKDTVRYFEIN